MGWFGEQMYQREKHDRELFEDAVLELASSVIGKSGAGRLNDERIVTKAAIDEILKYYHHRSADIPAYMSEPEDQLEYAFRPYGISYRKVRLSEKWYRRSLGPMIVYHKETGLPLVLLPDKLGGYYWHNEKGNKIAVDGAKSDLIESEALCFYKPLPVKKIGLPELVTYMKDCLSLADYLILIMLTLMVTLPGLAIPQITKFLSGFILESGNVVALSAAAAFMFAMIISAQLFEASRSLAVSRMEIKVSLPVEAAVMMRLLSLPAGFFRRYSAGELANRTAAVNKLCKLLFSGIVSSGLTLFASLFYIRQIHNYAPALWLPVLGINLAVIAVTIYAAHLKTQEEREVLEGDAEEAGISYAIISGVQKIKLAGAERRFFARWAKCYAEGASIKYNPPMVLKINSAITLGISLLGMVFLYYLAASNGVSPSAYLAFSAAYGSLSAAFTSFGSAAVEAAEIRPILEMVEPILSEEPEVPEGRETVSKLTGSVEFSNVYFRYDDTQNYVISGLDLKIKAGEYVAVVGKTGCGKSTLMRLLLGFETPDKGAIYYDKKDLRALEPVSLRRRVGVVAQDGALFHGDIFSNIAISVPQLTMEEAWEAAELAGIADDIREMPMGMHTFISEGQGGISGGQKQRLMIARAIAPKPKILLLDEATSALDNKTQKQVSDALEKLGCTRIVIAHRLSTVRHCDRILVLDEGKIVEEGSYDELIAKGGLFSELVARQQV